MDQAVMHRLAGLALIGLALAACDQTPRAPDLPHAPTALTPRFYAPPGWAWGRLKLADGAALRYGVASPTSVPKGAILILPERDEPAEVWFETAGDLNAKGYTVWVLESASGRGLAALDSGPLARMIGQVIRPVGGKPMVLIAHGLGATTAIRALSEGKLAGATAVMLASPDLELAGIDAPGSAEQAATAAEWISRARMGALPLPGDGQPRLTHAAPSGLEPRRAGLQATWRKSDPALKPARTTFGWLWGYDQVIKIARDPSPAKSGAPIVMATTASDLAGARACRQLRTCTLWAVPTTAPHLARDEVRRAWLKRVLELAERR